MSSTAGRQLTPEAKQALSATIRGLRERLLRDLAAEAERRYRLSVPATQAGLAEAPRRRRERLEAWLDERVRTLGAKGAKDQKAARERFLSQAIKEAAATLLNRLVLLRQLEALGLSKPAVVTGGWNSGGYRELCEFGPGVTGDETEGYAILLQAVFDDLAIDLPGLFGDVGLTCLFYVPPATLREIVAKLDDDALASAWTDDTTLGWVYQYWNDPEREELDAKINRGGKIEPHEIASKTQMFTERYMVEWLLQNSLGLVWLQICKRNGWRPDAEDVLPVLEDRRREWRGKRERGEVALDALMPIKGELEDAWKYFVPQPLPAETSEGGPRSIRDVRLLDPACGSGHFLIGAFDLLVRMHREEARHRGQTWSDETIVDDILAHNLHGVDIDPRAAQIAAAALYLKAKAFAPKVRLRRLNLVAPTLQLGNLPDDDPALVALRQDLLQEAGIAEDLTRRLMASLAGVDHLGTLLKVDAAVDEALQATDLEFERLGKQGSLFEGFVLEKVKLTAKEAKATVLDKLEQFLSRHSGAEDLGLRLDGEQLAAGVRFVRMVREGSYDVVVGNPPYQGLSKTSLSDYVAKKYPRGKADLYAAFLERGLELARGAGLSALLTMRGWMFLGQFAALRQEVLARFDLRAIGDFDRGAFDEVPNEVLAVAAPVLRKASYDGLVSVAVQPTPLDDKSYDRQRTNRKRAAVLAQVGRYEFDPKGFEVIEGEPIVYWWPTDLVARYATAPKLGQHHAARNGMSTQDNVRFLRRPWEVDRVSTKVEGIGARSGFGLAQWAPYIKGAAGQQWCEGLEDIVRWANFGLESKTFCAHLYGSHSRTIKNEALYFELGVAFAAIGSAFSARKHRFPSIFGHMGTSVFGCDPNEMVCLLNSSLSRSILASLNPGLHFLTSDVNRLPLWPMPNFQDIGTRIDFAFGEHEAARESSVEFKCPGPSPWRYAQDWAQHAVDRPDGAPLPAYEPEYDAPEPAALVSFAVGVALGRFGANGEGVLDQAPSTALPYGILFVADEGRDSLAHPACAALVDAWKVHGAVVGEGDDLRTYLRTRFFPGHKKLYDRRPIYLPLSSTKKNYVAFVSIHRFMRRLGDGGTIGDGTRFGDCALQVLLAEHLVPEKRRLEGELDDIRKARGEAKTNNKTERRYAELSNLLDELADFIAKVAEVAEQGPPAPDAATPKREQDARFVMDLDDGVMVNSAALWPLLEPQWKDPKKWWKELASAQGRKDYDWAHLAARYFPKRVEDKCVKDPSLAVAHGCFWRLHPAKAYAWELRLQDEIRPDFTIDEADSDQYRQRFLKDHPEEAEAARAKESQRRARKAAKSGDDDANESDTPLLDRTEEDELADA